MGSNLHSCGTATIRAGKRFSGWRKTLKTPEKALYCRHRSPNTAIMSQAPSSPRGLWHNLPNTILIKSQRPHGSNVMPTAPIPSEGGIIAFPPELEKDWEEYLSNDAKNRVMLDDEQHALYLSYLLSPSVPAEETAIMKRSNATSLKNRILRNYTLDGREI